MLATVLMFCVALVGPPHEEISAEELFETIEALPEARSIRAAKDREASWEGLRETEDLLIERLIAMGHEPCVQEFTWAPFIDWDPSVRNPPTLRDLPVRTRNIWVEIKGTERPDEIVMASCHFDAVPESPGANDNGTGVATVMAMARVFADQKPERTIRLLFFTAEEHSLSGSRRYVMEHVQPQMDSGEETFIGLINIDMIGAYSDEPGSQQLPDVPFVRSVFGEDPKGDFLAALTISGLNGVSFGEFNRTALGAMREASPELPILDTSFLPAPMPDMMRSDHAHFWVLSIPAMFCTDTAQFRTEHYHSPTDTVVHIDRERFPMAARASAAAIWALANPED